MDFRATVTMQSTTPKMQLEPYLIPIFADPVNALHQAEKIAAALMQHDPEHAEIFAENLAAFRQEIKALDQSIGTWRQLHAVNL